ncbi:Protein SGT1 [Nymphon striatum]|nr:Protein SGT1 [Nymphon striatum]
MAGGHHSPIQIVDNVISMNELSNFRMNHRELCEATLTDQKCIEFLATIGLIRNGFRCPECQIPMSLQNRRGTRYIDNCVWACRRCRRTKNIRHGSFFERSHLALKTISDIIYWWSMSVLATQKKEECKISSWSTIVDWLNFIRDVCANCIIDHPVTLGGEDKVVEIDESKFMHRKYHQGRFRDGHWVLGMVERGNNNCVMVIVPDRSAETLLPIIQQHVLPETKIITDGWRAYNALPNHYVVNHTLHFVDPDDPSIHTNTVEGSWAFCKKKFRQMHGTSDGLFQSYLQEHIWRRNFGGNPFGNILKDWYQTDTDVVLSIMIKDLKSEDVSLKIELNSVTVNAKLPNSEECSVTYNLAHSVVPEKSTWKVLRTKIEVKLKKETGGRWDNLEASEPTKNSSQDFASTPSYPSSSTAKKDWNEIGKEINKMVEEDKADGDAAVNELFQKIYKDGDDNLRRAMNKSFMESGGTVLSTNWSDVGKKEVEMKPPDGMEFKKWT